jgi:hypothetical protein
LPASHRKAQEAEMKTLAAGQSARKAAESVRIEIDPASLG